MTDTPWDLAYFRPTSGPDGVVATAATPLVVDDVPLDGFVANWLSSVRAEGYRLDVATDAGFAAMLPGYDDLAVAGLSANVIGLSSGVQYFYRVRADNRWGSSENSNVVSTEQMEAPVATAATDVEDNQFAANWEAVAGAGSYRLDVSEDPDFDSFVPGFQDAGVGDVLSYIVNGLEQETEYHYRVRAVGAAGPPSTSSNVIDVETPASFVATGGTVTNVGDDTVHKFTAAGDFTVVSGSAAVRRLIVAGGGPGGSINGSGVGTGGGGAGGVIEETEDMGPATYPVVVGLGGVPNAATNGTDGGNSSVDGSVAVGGGRGGGVGDAAGDPGGSGGGGSAIVGGGNVGSAGTAGQGNAGANGRAGKKGGGGGGAGAAGNNSNGGNGIQSDIDGTNRYYGGGGGGESTDGGGPGGEGLGGQGGGGNGHTSTGDNGVDGFGGGGGGTQWAGGGFDKLGGSGGKGVVILRYSGLGTPSPEFVGPILEPSTMEGNDIDIDFYSGDGEGALVSTDEGANELTFHFSEPIAAFKITHLAPEASNITWLAAYNAVGDLVAIRYFSTAVADDEQQVNYAPGIVRVTVRKATITGINYGHYYAAYFLPIE